MTKRAVRSWRGFANHALLIACGSLLHAQQPQATDLLARALHLALGAWQN